MANLPETATFVPVTQIETNEPVIGGASGVSNRGLAELTNRTAWCKQEIEALQSGTLDSAILAKLLGVDGDGSGLDADLVRGLPADFTSSKLANGWQRLPSGLIIQWGGAFVASEASAGRVMVSLPVTFPNALLMAFVTDRAVDVATNKADVVTWLADDSTASQLALIAVGNSTGAFVDSLACFLAIGH